LHTWESTVKFELGARTTIVPWEVLVLVAEVMTGVIRLKLEVEDVLLEAVEVVWVVDVVFESARNTPTPAETASRATTPTACKIFERPALLPLRQASLDGLVKRCEILHPPY